MRSQGELRKALSFAVDWIPKALDEIEDGLPPLRSPLAQPTVKIWSFLQGKDSRKHTKEVSGTTQKLMCLDSGFHMRLLNVENGWSNGQPVAEVSRRPYSSPLAGLLHEGVGGWMGLTSELLRNPY